MKDKIKICFWCKEPRETMIGKVRNEDKIFDGYVPCEKCQDKVGDNTMVIEARKTPIDSKQPAMTEDDTYPTGRWFAINPDSCMKMFDLKEPVNLLFINVETFNDIIEVINEK
jgi:hypothetical protein